MGTDGLRTTRRNAHWSLYRITNDYQWYKQDGRWNFEQVKSSRRVADGAIDLTPNAAARIAAVVGLGHYRLDLRDDDPSDSQTSTTFDVGWSGEAKAETPDLLDVTLDKPAYSSGDTIKLKISSRSDGKATLAVVGDGVKATVDADLKKGDNEIALPVGADWGIGAYALVLAHRPLDKAAGRMPGRAVGLAWFAVDPAAHRLDIALNAPARAHPREPMKLPIQLAGLAPGEEAYVTVAAVDVGILNLTRYQTPDPREHFYGQRALATEIRDVYGYLIDGLQGSRGQIRSGGNSGGEETSAEKPSQAPLALYSGPVRVGPDGKADIAFDLPAFNGTVRVTAVAWSKSRAGSASADVIVRDPVVVQASLPRFLALDDVSRLNLRLDNVEGAAGDYKLSVELHGPLSADAAALHQTVKLGAGAAASVNVPLRATGVGPATLDVTLTGPKFEATQRLALDVEPGTSALVKRSFHDLQPGESLVLSRDLLADFIPATGAVTATVAPLGGVDVAGLLGALDTYPWSCSEQTVSRALPLLYLSALTGATIRRSRATFRRGSTAPSRCCCRGRIRAAASACGRRKGAEDIWLTAFVTDFLTRARENKYAVPQRAMDNALDRLRNYVVNASDAKVENGAGLAYAIYVLARNGRPVAGDLRYLVDARLDAFDTPFSRAQLAAALALIGDRARASTVFAAAADTLQKSKATSLSRADYGSLLRDGAGLLTLASESQADQSVIVKAAQVVDSEAAATPSASTQEESWMVLAAQAMAAQAEGQKLAIDGAPHQGVYSARFDDSALAQKPVTIVNQGQAPVRVAVGVSGRPMQKEPEESHGYTIERGFYRLDGTPVDPHSIVQNERLVVALKITETEAAFARLILEDRLPAGLEIDNPDLFDGGSAEDLQWVKAEVAPTHTEARDDRFVAAFERSGSDKATFAIAYVVRAVSPGQYVLPPATIEDMYRPARFGRTGFRHGRDFGKREEVTQDRRRIWLTAAIAIGFLGLAIPGAWLNVERALGPLDLSALDRASTVAVDRDGNLLRAFETKDGRWRLPLRASEVDPRFFTLLKAYEDKNFERHHGVDSGALLRAAWQYVRHGHAVSGGSTLTMQAARLLEPRAERTLLAKARQIVRAFQLESRFSKTQILDIYLALAPYGGNLEGLRAASLAFFGKEPRRLSTGEAALLVALPQAPEARRPDHAPKAARAARDRVIDRALAAHVLSESEARHAKAEPPPLLRQPFPTLAAARDRGAAPRSSRTAGPASDDRRAPAGKPRNSGARPRRAARAETDHGDAGHRQRHRADPRPCRQRRLFLEGARRRDRHDARRCARRARR